MADVYLPHGWPEAVAPPGTPDWTDSAVAFPGKSICSADRTDILFPCHSHCSLFPPVTVQT